MLPRRRHLECGSQGLTRVCQSRAGHPLYCASCGLAFPGCTHRLACVQDDCLRACKSLQSYLTLCNRMDCSPPGSSPHGMLQARMLEWASLPSSRGSSPPRDRTWVSCGYCIAARFFAANPPGKPKKMISFTKSHLTELLLQLPQMRGNKHELLSTTVVAWLLGTQPHCYTTAFQHSANGEIHCLLHLKGPKHSSLPPTHWLIHTPPQPPPHTPTLPILGLKIMPPGNLFPDALSPHKPPRVTPQLPTQSRFNAPLLCSLMGRADSLGKTLVLGKIEGKRRRGRQRRR